MSTLSVYIYIMIFGFWSFSIRAMEEGSCNQHFSDIPSLQKNYVKWQENKNNIFGGNGALNTLLRGIEKDFFAQKQRVFSAEDIICFQKKLSILITDIMQTNVYLKDTIDIQDTKLKRLYAMRTLMNNIADQSIIRINDRSAIDFSKVICANMPPLNNAYSLIQIKIFSLETSLGYKYTRNNDSFHQLQDVCLRKQFNPQKNSFDRGSKIILGMGSIGLALGLKKILENSHFHEKLIQLWGRMPTITEMEKILRAKLPRTKIEQEKAMLLITLLSAVGLVSADYFFNNPSRSEKRAYQIIGTWMHNQYNAAKQWVSSWFGRE